MPASKKPSGYERLLAAQTTLGPTAEKSKRNPAFAGAKFIPLPALMELVHPVLIENALILTQGGCPAPVGYVGVLTRIIDALSGDVLAESNMQVPCLPENPQKGIGAVTYGRRTGITCVLAIAEADDDGNACSKPDKTSRPEAGASGGPERKDLW
jgi:hypothetical protein